MEKKILNKRNVICFLLFIICLTGGKIYGAKFLNFSQLKHENGTSMPSYPGGTEALYSFINYKSESVMAELKIMNRLSGKVNVMFFVEPDGSISNIVIEKSSNPYLDPIAIKVIEGMPKWIPGTQNGKPVRVEFKLPLVFR